MIKALIQFGLFCFAFGLVVFVACNGLAQDEKSPKDPWIGVQVMPKLGAALMRKGKPLELRDISVPALVVDADKEFLWLESKGRKSEIRRDEAVLLDDALDYYDEQIKNQPDQLEPYVLKACVFLEREDYESTRIENEKAIAIDAENVLTRRISGSYYYATTDYGKANEQYEALLKLYPDDAAFISSAANCYVLLGDYETALEYFDKAIGIESMGVYYTGRAQAHRLLKNYGKAIRDARFGVKKATESYSDSWRSTAQIILAYCYYYTEPELIDAEKALDAMLKAYEYKPFKRADFYQMTVSLCKSVGDEDEMDRFQKLTLEFLQESSFENETSPQK